MPGRAICMLDGLPGDVEEQCCTETFPCLPRQLVLNLQQTGVPLLCSNSLPFCSFSRDNTALHLLCTYTGFQRTLVSTTTLGQSTAPCIQPETEWGWQEDHRLAAYFARAWAVGLTSVAVSPGRVSLAHSNLPFCLCPQQVIAENSPSQGKES